MMSAGRADASISCENARAKEGVIINVSSTASFQPIPFFATYAATKAFVTSFSEAIAEENRPHNIQVLNLCPGPTETGFLTPANINDEFQRSAWLKKPANSRRSRRYGSDCDSKRKNHCGFRLGSIIWFDLRIMSRRIGWSRDLWRSSFALRSRNGMKLWKSKRLNLSPRNKMKFTVLGSGSTGNCVLIATEKTKVLIDAGLSAKQILLRLGAVGVDFEEFDGILITHEHGDHAGGLRVLLRSRKMSGFYFRKNSDAYLRDTKDEKQRSAKTCRCH